MATYTGIIFWNSMYSWKNISTFSVTDWSCCFSHFSYDVNTHYHQLSDIFFKNQKYSHSISERDMYINLIFNVLCLTFDFTPNLSKKSCVGELLLLGHSLLNIYLIDALDVDLLKTICDKVILFFPFVLHI